MHLCMCSYPSQKLLLVTKEYHKRNYSMDGLDSDEPFISKNFKIRSSKCGSEWKNAGFWPSFCGQKNTTFRLSDAKIIMMTLTLRSKGHEKPLIHLDDASINILEYRKMEAICVFPDVSRCFQGPNSWNPPSVHISMAKNDDGINIDGKCHHTQDMVQKKGLIGAPFFGLVMGSSNSVTIPNWLWLLRLSPRFESRSDSSAVLVLPNLARNYQIHIFF